MQASNGETKGLGVTIGGRRPSWKKVVGKSVTHHHVLACGGCRRWKVTLVEAREELVVVGVFAGV